MDSARGRALPLLLVAVAIGAVVGLGAEFGYPRTLIAVLFGGVILVFGIRFVAQMLVAPPEPEVTDVSGQGLRYICSMCGLELRVEKAARDKAPSHCMEPMVLVREDGKPPLHPV